MGIVRVVSRIYHTLHLQPVFSVNIDIGHPIDGNSRMYISVWITPIEFGSEKYTSVLVFFFA